MSSTVSDLQYQLRQRQRHLDQRVVEARITAQRGKDLSVEVLSLHQQRDILEKAAAVLASIGDTRQSTAQQQIESLVTRGLQTIFGEELSFHLVSDVKGKSPVVEFVVRTTYPDGSVLESSILDSRGGGIASVTGFLLRLVVMLLSGKDQQHVLFLDESFAMVSADYEPRLSEFLREIVDKTGVQVLLITHSTAFSDLADKVYDFKLDKQGYTIARSGS